MQVSWIRKRDLHILSAGLSTYTSDERFQVQIFLSSKHIFLFWKKTESCSMEMLPIADSSVFSSFVQFFHSFISKLCDVYKSFCICSNQAQSLMENQLNFSFPHREKIYSEIIKNFLTFVLCLWCTVFLQLEIVLLWKSEDFIILRKYRNVFWWLVYV